MPYQVAVDDNFHYMDKDARYGAGEFATAAEALAKARKIVDDYLATAFEAGMNADALYSSYQAFGEDPFITATGGDPSVVFSAWDYAKERCAQLCAGR
jgi:hypothetical protein